MRKFLVGVAGLLVVTLILAVYSAPALEPKTRTFDIYMWEKKPHGEPPLEKLLPGSLDLLVTEFHHWEPSVLVAFKGDTIVLNVSNPRGTVHSLTIPDFKVDTGPLAPKGGKATVKFVADKAGVFAFMSGTPWNPKATPEECDPGHKYQTGSLIILER